MAVPVALVKLTVVLVGVVRFQRFALVSFREKLVPGWCERWFLLC